MKTVLPASREIREDSSTVFGLMLAAALASEGTTLRIAPTQLPAPNSNNRGFSPESAPTAKVTDPLEGESDSYCTGYKQGRYDRGTESKPRNKRHTLFELARWWDAEEARGYNDGYRAAAAEWRELNGLKRFFPTGGGTNIMGNYNR